MEHADPTEATCVANVIRTCQLIPTVVTLYDHLITLDQEIELVWKKPQTLAKTMFLWNRYFGSLFLLTDTIMFSVPPSHNNLYVLVYLVSYCHGRFWFVFQGCGTAIIIWSMQSTMLLCTRAMYPHSPYIRLATLVSFIFEITSMSVILTIAITEFEATSSSPSGYVFCTPYHIPTFLYAFWIPAIALDCFFFVLVIWVLGRHRGRIAFATTGSVLKTLTRDSILYSFVTLLVYVANAVVWITLPARWAGLPQAFSAAGTCTMGVKLVLNLRGAYYYQSIASPSLASKSAAASDALFDEGTVAFHAPSSISLPDKIDNPPFLS